MLSQARSKEILGFLPRWASSRLHVVAGVKWCLHICLTNEDFKPLCNTLFLENMKIYFYFLSFLDNEMAQFIGFNSLPPGIYFCDSKCVNFKHNLEIGILSFQVSITMELMPHSIEVNIVSGNGLVPSGNKPLPEPGNVDPDLYCHMASLGHIELILVEDKDQPILYGQHNQCWWHGDIWSQVIICGGTDCDLPEYSDLSIQ